MNKSKIAFFLLLIPLILSLVLKVKILTAILIVFVVSLLCWEVYQKILDRKE